jgi:gamma-glutamyltranspeptidase / glutathione hydrolase
VSLRAPTILAKDGQLFMVTGSPGGRTIINTVLETIVDVVDFGMNAQEAIDAARFPHQWRPDRIDYERTGCRRTRLRSSNGAATRCGSATGRVWRR